MGVVTMWFAYYSPVNDRTSRTIQQLPAGRSEEVVPSLPPILSCATDFTDVGEGKAQGRNLHNKDSIQQQFNKSSFIRLISLSWSCRAECLNLKHFVCILVGKCHEWGNSPLVLPVEGLWVHTCSGAFLVNFYYHKDYYNNFKNYNNFKICGKREWVGQGLRWRNCQAPKCMLTWAQPPAFALVMSLDTASSSVPAIPRLPIIFTFLPLIVVRIFKAYY